MSAMREHYELPYWGRFGAESQPISNLVHFSLENTTSGVNSFNYFLRID